MNWNSKGLELNIVFNTQLPAPVSVTKSLVFEKKTLKIIRISFLSFTDNPFIEVHFFKINFILAYRQL